MPATTATRARRARRCGASASCTTASVDTLFRFHNATVFNGGFNPNGGDTTRRQVEQFVLAFDSNLAPIVGQQTTLTNTNAATAGPRIDLLLARAGQNECEVVVKGTLGSVQASAVRAAGPSSR